LLLINNINCSHHDDDDDDDEGNNDEQHHHQHPHDKDIEHQHKHQHEHEVEINHEHDHEHHDDEHEEKEQEHNHKHEHEHNHEHEAHDDEHEEEHSLLSVGIAHDHNKDNNNNDNNFSFTDYFYDASSISEVPADKSVCRPEDGVAFEDGTIYVSDCHDGLRKISADHRTSERFGNIIVDKANHDLPNGVFYDKRTDSFLVAIFVSGKIWEVDKKTQESKMIYQHPYGINDMVRDSRGTIWATVSTSSKNFAGFLVLKKMSEEAKQIPGQVLRIPQQEGGGYLPNSAEVLYTSAGFINGVTLDSAETYLFVAETVLNRILRFAVEADGTLSASSREVYARVPTWIDNIDMDENGYIFAGLPLLRGGCVVTPKSKSVLTFNLPNEASMEVDEASAEQLPAVLMKNWLQFYGTSMFLSHDKKKVFFGNARTQDNEFLTAFDFPLELN